MIEVPRVLVVSATTEEAAHVPGDLPLLVTGIGKVAASVGVAAALASVPAGEPLPVVVNVGTCGALRAGLSGVLLPSAVVNHDLDVASLARLGLIVSSAFSLGHGDGSVLATGDTFVTDAQHARQLAEQAWLVDMEGYAVAAACAKVGARCLLVKHVSDGADETAWNWNDAVERSARALGEWLRDELGDHVGRAGVPAAA